MADVYRFFAIPSDDKSALPEFKEIATLTDYFVNDKGVTIAQFIFKNGAPDEVPLHEIILDPSNYQRFRSGK